MHVARLLVASVSGGIGCGSHGDKGGNMMDRKAVSVQRDERAAHLPRGMVIVLSRFEAVRPADALPEHRGVVGMAMTHEDTVDTCFMEPIHEVLGGAEAADGLPLTAEITVFCERGDSDDVLFMLVGGLVALLHRRTVELEARDMEAQESGNGGSPIHLSQPVGGGVQPGVLILAKAGATANRRIG